MATEKMMSRVMKLLELAADPGASEAERALAAETADRLMAQHTIDRMDLKKEEQTGVKEDTWVVNVGDSAEFRSHMIKLMTDIVDHCGIRLHPRANYAKRDDGTTDYTSYAFVLVGFPEDIAYAEQIWLRVFWEFVSNVSPTWDSSKSLADNTYQFIKAGFSWIETYQIGRRSQYGEWPMPMPNGAPVLRRAYKEALEERGEAFQKTKRRAAYRASFVQSYGATINRRLVDMRRKSKEAVGDSDRFALALRSTKERVDEEFYRLYPEFDPEVRRKMYEAQAFEAACEFAALSEKEQQEAIRKQAAEDARWNRAAGRARRNYGALRTNATVDEAAWARGQEVGSRVNLNVDGEVKNRKKGELK